MYRIVTYYLCAILCVGDTGKVLRDNSYNTRENEQKTNFIREAGSPCDLTWLEFFVGQTIETNTEYLEDLQNELDYYFIKRNYMDTVMKDLKNCESVCNELTKIFSKYSAKEEINTGNLADTTRTKFTRAHSIKNLLEFLEADTTAIFLKNILRRASEYLHKYHWKKELAIETSLLDETQGNLKRNKDSMIIGDLDIDTEKLVHDLPEEFLSMALGSKLIDDRFKNLPKQRAKFLKLASSFTPAYIRVGGSGANFLMFDPRRNNDVTEIPHAIKDDPGAHKEICEKQLHDDFTNFTMTGDQWDFLTGLVRDLGWTMLFDLNQFTRGDQGVWDSENAKLIFDDPATSSIPIIWELGNEPNAYEHKFGWVISPSRAAADYKNLRRLLENKFDPIKSVLLVGPDVTRPRKFEQMGFGEDSMEFLAGFLKEANRAVDAVSWHHFYLNGRTATVEDFLSVDVMNIFPKQVAEMVSMRDTYAPHKPVWLTETAIAFGGGAPELSESFAATFLWLDELGTAAQRGISMVFRQALFGGCYGIIDAMLNPTPSYWISTLHKQLVGQKVLLPRVHMVPESIRIYAHCLQKTHELYIEGAIVIFGLSVNKKTTVLNLLNENLQASSKYHYHLTAPSGDVTSRSIQMNEEILKPLPDGELPVLEPKLILTNNLSFASKSISFYVLPEARHKVCG